MEGVGGDLTYQWFKGGQKITDDGKYQGTRTSQLTITDTRKGDEGVFSCLIENDLGNATSQNIILLSVGKLTNNVSTSLH